MRVIAPASRILSTAAARLSQASSPGTPSRPKAVAQQAIEADRLHCLRTTDGVTSIWLEATHQRGPTPTGAAWLSGVSGLLCRKGGRAGRRPAFFLDARGHGLECQ